MTMETTPKGNGKGDLAVTGVCLFILTALMSGACYDGGYPGMSAALGSISLFAIGLFLIAYLTPPEK